MSEHESSEHTSAAGTVEARAHLIAAGEAVRDWASARRATWTDRPLVIPPTVVPRKAGPVATPPAEVRVNVQEPRDPSPARSAVSAAQAPPPDLWTADPSPPTRAAASTTDTVREPLVQWSRRAALVAVLAAMVGVAGWTARIQWAKWTAAPKNGTAFLDSVPPGSDIVVGGKPMGKTPITVELPPGQHLVEFRRRGAAPRTLDVVVKAGESTVGVLDWTVKRVGRLQVRSNPDGATVLVDGRERGVAPLTIDDLTAGSHTVMLVSNKGSVQRAVVVKADSTTELSEAIYAGWLHLTSSVELEVREGNRPVRLDGQNSVLLPPGSHALHFENRQLGYRETRQVVINPGETTAISIVAQTSALTITATLPAQVFIDGERVGETPLGDQRVNLGTHEIAVRSVSGAERRFTITVRAEPTRIDVDFAKP